MFEPSGEPRELADHASHADVGQIEFAAGRGSVSRNGWDKPKRTGEQGCRLALLTNGGSKGQRLKIDRFNLAMLFDVILIEGEVGFGKPDPRIYTKALAALDVPASEAWMIGDNLE